MSNKNELWRALSPSQVWVTSSANEELVKDFPTHQDKPFFNTISFVCKTPCTVNINNGEEVLEINPDLGLERDGRFRPIYSFIIEQAGIEYYFLAGY